MYCGVDIVVRQAIRLISGNTTNLLQLAQSAADAGNPQEAYDYYNKVLEADPKNVDAWLGKGKAAGWLSRLVAFRFNEMLVAFENALAFSDEHRRSKLRPEIALALNDVATACFSITLSHVREFPSVEGTWEEYLGRCKELMAVYEVAHSYDPTRSHASSDPQKYRHCLPAKHRRHQIHVRQCVASSAGDRRVRAGSPSENGASRV
jgi:tetratricopeptide (TPR) repeat protein